MRLTRLYQFFVVPLISFSLSPHFHSLLSHHQMTSMYESVMTTCFLAVAAGAVWAKVIAILFILAINGVLVMLFKKIKKEAKALPYTKFEWPKEGGRCKRNVCEPARLMLCASLTGDANQRPQGAGDEPKERTQKLILGGYGELFGAYTQSQANFWIFTFIEQFIRVFTLSLLPGVVQAPILIILSYVSFHKVTFKKPFLSRVENFQCMYGKLVEFLSFLLLGILPYINLAAPGYENRDRMDVSQTRGLELCSNLLAFDSHHSTLKIRNRFGWNVGSLRVPNEHGVHRRHHTERRVLKHRPALQGQGQVRGGQEEQEEQVDGQGSAARGLRSGKPSSSAGRLNGQRRRARCQGRHPDAGW